MVNPLGQWFQVPFGTRLRIPLRQLSGFWWTGLRINLRRLSGFRVALVLVVPEIIDSEELKGEKRGYLLIITFSVKGNLSQKSIKVSGNERQIVLLVFFYQTSVRYNMILEVFYSTV